LGFFKYIASLISFMQLPRAQRRVVFYSEGPAYWTHLQGLLSRFLDVADVPVCYFGSDREDPGLALTHPNLTTFLIDEGWVRDWLFENIDTDLVVLTTPDLHQHQLKRSRHDVHYVYVQHSLVSLHMAYRPGAFDHFDTVFCAGPHHVSELRALEVQRGTRKKNIVEHGYARLDQILAGQPDRQQLLSIAEQPTQVLIAPSWGPNGIIERLGNAPVEALLRAGHRVTLRPHPQTTRLNTAAVDSIVTSNQHNPLFEYDDDVSSTSSLLASDVMVSDWSGAALDYAFGLGKPVIFIDTPRKVNNSDYAALNIEPFESSIRNIVGEIVAEDSLAELGDVVRRLIDYSSRADMRELAERHVFNLGRSSEVGATALQQLLAECRP
jgi:hypothetical protein